MVVRAWDGRVRLVFIYPVRTMVIGSKAIKMG